VVHGLSVGLVEEQLELGGEVEGEGGADCSAFVIEGLDGPLHTLGVLAGQAGVDSDTYFAEAWAEGGVDVLGVSVHGAHLVAVGVVRLEDDALDGI
jgi:hypothetical protein